MKVPHTKKKKKRWGLSGDEGVQGGGEYVNQKEGQGWGWEQSWS